MIRRTAAALTATAGLALLAAGFSSPASAGTNCPSGYHCVFWTNFSSASHRYFTSDANFTNDTFNVEGNGDGYGYTVNDNVGSASNSSTGGYESHYYVNINPTTSRTLAFCVNPGTDATQTEVLNAGKGDLGSALILRSETSVHCL
jgi:hypothetical protein